MDDGDVQLDSLRIRQLASLRRATYRSRSHAIIAAGVCAVAAVQGGLIAAGEFRRRGLSIGVLAYTALLVLAVYGAYFFIRRAIRLHREANQTTIPEPSHPPDFSTLGDGSDLVDKLNRIE